MLRSKSAPTANELDDADSAIFAANEAIGAAGEDGEESDTPDTITYTPPKKNAAAKMLARIHLDAVAARVLKDASLARRLELAAALGDKRLGAAPMPAAIKAPALSEASYAVEAARSVFNDAQEAAKPDPLAYAMKLTEEEVAALATIITALRLPHQRGDQVHFPDAGVLMTLAATHGVNFREGFTPNEAFFAPFDLADLRKLAIELSDAKEMRTIQTSSRRDLIRNLSRHFAEAAETPDSLDPVTLAFNDWTPKYF